MRRDTVVRTMPGLAAAPGPPGATVPTGGTESRQVVGTGLALLLETGVLPGASRVDQAQSADH